MRITRELLRSYLESNFALNVQEIDDETQLFSDGLLDSFSVADMVLFIEDEGNFAVEPEEITYENLDTIANILDYAKRKSESVSG